MARPLDLPGAAMRLNPSCNELRPLAEYAARLPSSRPGKKLNRSTLWRWALRGTAGGARLQTVKIGSARYTSDAWFTDFIAQQSEPTSQAEPTPTMSRQDRDRIKLRFGT